MEINKSHFELRTQFHKMVVADLLGSSGGADEIMDEATVHSRL
jgi:hypothetical protein